MILEKPSFLSSSLANFFQPRNILSLSEIHIWRANLDCLEDRIFQCSFSSKKREANDSSEYLQPLELSVAEKFSSPLLRKRFENSRKVTRKVLSNYLRCAPQAVVFEKEVFGKPVVANFPEISFSVAHSGAVMLLAISHNLLGIDVELIKPVNSFEIAKKFFSTTESEFLKQGDHEKRFFQLWTAKEAALKADGRGITRGLRSAFSRIEKNKVSAVDLFEKEWMINSFCFEIAEDHFMAALAFAAPQALIRWYDFN